MQKKALVVIDIQNEITKNYKGVIDNINKAVDWAVESGCHVIYTRHENLSQGSRVVLLFYPLRVHVQPNKIGVN